MLPLGLGYVEGVTHDYVRHGTTTLFAALDLASGQVLTRCQPRHRHQEFLQFLKDLETNVPPELDIHLVVDNYATHKHEESEALAGGSSSLPRALHAHLLLLAESGGDLV